MNKEKDKKNLKKIEELNEEFDKIMAERDEYLFGWKREKADFINYKKEEGDRIKKIIKYSNEEIVLNILPILDNLFIAENNIPKDLENNEWVKGLMQIKNQILDFLKNYGIEEIKSVGEKFNPEFHEAIEQIKKKDSESGTIIQEIKRGYILNNKTIRPASVRVAK
ncbi:MAG: nucleotide exchange factor GrpE [Candidatus Nealsonbacteria bacterium]